MKRRLSKLLVGTIALGAVGTFALLAHAWVVKAPFDATINEHHFYEMKVWNDECKLKVRLRFTAPKDGYQATYSKRNYYRFKSRLEMSDNITVDSPVFGNRKPGRRVYSFTKDTTAGGCWAKRELKVFDVDIEGCRGRKCRVHPFEE
jgi:hypothetical protein